MRLLSEIGYLFVRGLKQSMRPKAALIPSLFMPAFFFLINSAAFAFLTTAQLPLHLLHGWYRAAVQINPVTYVLEGIRSLTSGGWDGDVIVRGFIVAIATGVVTISLVMASFRRAYP